jgi:hypothetical protein
MRNADVEPPMIRTEQEADRLTITITPSPVRAELAEALPYSADQEQGEGFDKLSPNGRVGVSAILEDRDGTKSYWALAHPPGKPDFHDPACFALELAAPRRP